MAIDLKHIKQAPKAPKSAGKSSWGDFMSRDISLGATFNDKKKERFYSDLFTLFQAGVDLRSALELMLQEKRKAKEEALLRDIRDKVVKGSSFSKALEESGEFSPYEFFSIRIGEETGGLAEVLQEMAKYYAKRIELKRQLVKVFSYPVFVIVLAFGVVYFMMRYIVPMFGTIFKRFGSELPGMTKKVIALSDFMVEWSPLFFTSLFALILFFYLQRKKTWFRKFTGYAVLKIPFFGDLIRKVYLARLCQSLQLLVASRTNLTDALAMVEQMIGFYPLEEALQTMRADLLKGQKLSTSMAKFPVFDQKMVSLIKVAEEVNQLSEMFQKLSTQYSSDVDHRTGTLGSVMEPVLMILIGGIVGFILIALYLPMFNLGGMIK